MVTIETIHAANTTLTTSHPLTAVFVGGTSGIGEYTFKALATAHGTQGRGLRAYIVGRNETAGKATIAECTRVCPSGRFGFIKAGDLALLKDVDSVSREIARVVEEGADGPARIDLLIMTQGKSVFGPRVDTPEGLDRTMSLMYYSRIRLIHNLTPLLTTTPALPSHIISVYAGGMEATLHASDLSLRAPGHYSFGNARSHIGHMKTMAFEQLARTYAGRMSLVHVYPGLVPTPGFEDPGHPLWFKVAWRVLGSVAMWAVGIEPGESGKRTVFCATGRFVAKGGVGKGAEVVAVGTDGKSGGGAYAVNAKSDTVAPNPVLKKLREDGFREKVWEHTMSVFETVEAGGMFTG